MASDTDTPKQPMMVERVARAISENNFHNDETIWSRLWDELPAENRSTYIRIARAAIDAMREPTEAMEDAADSEAERYFGNSHECLSPAHAYRVMIDAALKE